jgi:hypothetical protein
MAGFSVKELRAEADRRERETAVSGQTKKLETSKLMLFLVMVTYFIGVFYGLYAVNRILLDYPEWAIQALIAIFSYIGVPISVAIGFYSWKAKNENALKIPNVNRVMASESVPFEGGLVNELSVG